MEVNLTCCSSGNLKLFSRQHHDRVSRKVKFKSLRQSHGYHHKALNDRYISDLLCVVCFHSFTKLPFPLSSTAEMKWSKLLTTC